MSEMVERVAREIEPLAWAALGTGDTFAYEVRRRASLLVARRVIEKMRKPTEAMERSCGNGECAKWAPGAWLNYIDAALSEGEKA